MLNVSNLHVSYGQSEVLHGLDFDVAPGEIVVLVGRNGMGKTTLMKSLIGMVPVKAGAITLDGTDISHMPSYRRARISCKTGNRV
jgi:urea transport system ATP-binding protein